MTLWLGKAPLVLASQSKARQTLLANAGIEFESDPADIDERAIQASSGLSAPGDIAGLLAREKARTVWTAAMVSQSRTGNPCYWNLSRD